MTPYGQLQLGMPRAVAKDNQDMTKYRGTTTHAAITAATLSPDPQSWRTNQHACTTDRTYRLRLLGCGCPVPYGGHCCALPCEQLVPHHQGLAATASSCRKHQRCAPHGDTMHKKVRTPAQQPIPQRGYAAIPRPELNRSLVSRLLHMSAGKRNACGVSSTAAALQKQSSPSPTAAATGKHIMIIN